MDPSFFQKCTQSSESFISQFKNAFTNLTYNISNSEYINIPGLFQEKILFATHDPPAYLLGTHYNYSTQQQFNLHFRNTIWFSYRKNIPHIGNDTGWGCMIRSTMMMIAEALKRTSSLPLPDILGEFQDKGNYSLASICKQGQIANRWTTAHEIVSICQRISKSQLNSPLSILNIPYECIMFRDIEVQIKQGKRKALIVLQTKLGMGALEPCYVPHLKEVMKLKQFCGMLGGSPGKAMFILGFKDDKVVGLDPHYVQDDNGVEQFYFKEFPRGLSFTKLDSSISVGFYIDEIAEYYELVHRLMSIEQVIPQHRAIGVVMTQEDKARLKELLPLGNRQQSQTGDKNKRKESEDDFQLIE